MSHLPSRRCGRIKKHSSSQPSSTSINTDGTHHLLLCHYNQSRLFHEPKNKFCNRRVPVLSATSSLDEKFKTLQGEIKRLKSAFANGEEHVTRWKLPTLAWTQTVLTKDNALFWLQSSSLSPRQRSSSPSKLINRLSVLRRMSTRRQTVETNFTKPTHPQLSSAVLCHWTTTFITGGTAAGVMTTSTATWSHF